MLLPSLQAKRVASPEERARLRSLAPPGEVARFTRRTPPKRLLTSLAVKVVVSKKHLVQIKGVRGAL